MTSTCIYILSEALINCSIKIKIKSDFFLFILDFRLYMLKYDSFFLRKQMKNIEAFCSSTIKSECDNFRSQLSDCESLSWVSLCFKSVFTVSWGERKTLQICFALISFVLDESPLSPLLHFNHNFPSSSSMLASFLPARTLHCCTSVFTGQDHSNTAENEFYI